MSQYNVLYIVKKNVYVFHASRFTRFARSYINRHFGTQIARPVRLAPNLSLIFLYTCSHNANFGGQRQPTIEVIAQSATNWLRGG
jgi:hypothetical protein